MSLPAYFRVFRARHPDFDPRRLPDVRRAMRDHLRKFGSCAWCGARRWLQVHHIKPVSKNPELAADTNNMLTLCGHRGCHRVIGHYGDFRRINPHAPAACAYFGDAP